MKKTISCTVALLVLAALVLGQVAVGSTLGAVPALPSHASQVPGNSPVGFDLAVDRDLDPAPSIRHKVSEPDRAGKPEDPDPQDLSASPSDTLDQKTFLASEDVDVLEGYPTMNLGNSDSMWVGYDTYLDPDAERCRGLIKFNISALPSGCDITSAVLRVRLILSYDAPGTAATITAYRIASSWSENGTTWNNQPGFGGAYDSESILHSAWDWYEFDVVNLVKAWYSGTYTNHGIMLRGPESEPGWRGFGTKQTGSGNIPELVVNYTCNGCGTNTAPTISGLPNVDLAPGSSRNNAVDLWAYTNDAESTDSQLTFTIDNAPDPGAGVSLDSGRYLDVFPTSGWTGQTTVTIRVTDPCGASDTDSLVVRRDTTPPPPTDAFLPVIIYQLGDKHPHEPNNSFGEAWGPLASGQVLRSNFPFAADVHDFFYFQMPAPHEIDVRLDKVPFDGDYDIYLYDSVEGQIGKSTKIGLGSPERITVGRVPAGKYYIRVTRAEGPPERVIL